MAFLCTAFRSLRIGTQHTGRKLRPVLNRSLHASRCNAAVFSKANKETLSQVLKDSSAGRVVLVDFYADWCQPCRMLSPILEKYSSEPNTSANGIPVDLVKIDTETDNGQELAMEHKVRALPTVLVYKDGKPAGQFTGALPEAQVKELLDSL